MSFQESVQYSIVKVLFICHSDAILQCFESVRKAAYYVSIVAVMIKIKNVETSFCSVDDGF